MEYFKLILGIVILGTFFWLIVRMTKRSHNVGNTIARIDIIIGLVAGLYLVITSLGAIL